MSAPQRQHGKSPRFDTAASPSLANSSPLASSARAFANQHNGSAPSSPFRAQLSAFPALGALHEADDFDSSLRAQQAGAQYNTDDLADFFGSSSINGDSPPRKQQQQTSNMPNRLNMPINQLDDLLKTWGTKDPTTGARKHLADLIREADEAAAAERASGARSAMPQAMHRAHSDQTLYPDTPQMAMEPPKRTARAMSATASPASTYASYQSAASSLAESTRTADLIRAGIRAAKSPAAPATPATPLMDGLRFFRDSERLRKQNRENEALYKRYEIATKDQEMVKRAEEVARARHEAIVKQRMEYEQQQAARIREAMDASQKAAADREAARLKALEEAAATAAAAEKAKLDTIAAEQVKAAEAEALKKQQEAEEAAKAEAAKVRMTPEDRRHIYDYLCHLCFGQPRVPAYDELYTKYHLASEKDPELRKELTELMDCAQRVVQSQIQDAAARHAEEVALRQKEAAIRAEEEALRAERLKEKRKEEPLLVPIGGSPAARTSPKPARSPAATEPSPLPQAAPSPSLGLRTPQTPKNDYHPGSTVADVLTNIVDIEERARVNALSKMMDLRSPGKDNGARLVEVSLQPSAELRALTNSTVPMDVSIYPLPSPDHPKYLAILEAQISTAMAYLRQAAAQFGAQHITQLHVQESEKSPDMGRLSVKLVQLKSLGPEGPQPGPPMQITEGYQKYSKQGLPDGITRNPFAYELMIQPNM